MNKKLITNDTNCNKFMQIHAIFFLTILVLVSVTVMNYMALVNNPNISNLSIFYINDVHGQTGKMRYILDASKKFDKTISVKQNIGTLKLSSGDISIGVDKNISQAATDFKNQMGIDIETLGNHEFDANSDAFADEILNSNAQLVATNIVTAKNSPLNKKFKKSYIKEINGEKYGFLGILPTDLNKRSKSETISQVKVFNDDETIKALQQEVKELEKQGINKIILISHGGYELEQKIAHNVSGIDIIHGGHSHQLMKGIVSGKNYFKSPANEPVIYTQTGCDGQHYGILNVIFKNGVIIKADNQVVDTIDKNTKVLPQADFEKHLGEETTVGMLKSVEPFPENRQETENPYADFMLDAILSETNADIAFMNSGSLRGTLAEGTVTDRDITLLSPFKNKLCLAYLSEEDIVQTLQNGLNSIKTPEKKPGIVQVGGLSYIGTADGLLKEAYFIDKSGNKHKINLQSPNKEKKYLAAFDDFMGSGKEGFDALHNAKLKTKFDCDKDYFVTQNIKKLQNEPFEIKVDGRIKIIKNLDSAQTRELSDLPPALDPRLLLQQTVWHTDSSWTTVPEKSPQTPTFHRIA